VVACWPFARSAPEARFLFSLSMPLSSSSNLLGSVGMSSRILRAFPLLRCRFRVSAASLFKVLFKQTNDLVQKYISLLCVCLRLLPSVLLHDMPPVSPQSLSRLPRAMHLHASSRTPLSSLQSSVRAWAGARPSNTDPTRMLIVIRTITKL